MWTLSAEKKRNLRNNVIIIRKFKKKMNWQRIFSVKWSQNYDIKLQFLFWKQLQRHRKKEPEKYSSFISKYFSGMSLHQFAANKFCET